jgi:putative transposase
MPQGLKRLQQSGQSHFVTFSCYHRRPKLTNLEACRIFLEALEAARKRFAIRVYGYVLMPEHVHLLLSEPASLTLAEAIHFVKLSSAKQLRSKASRSGETTSFWQARYYDRNIRDYREFVLKLRYLHRNPVKRGLCQSAEQWPWSSFQHYLTGAKGLVEIESEWAAKKREMEKVSAFPG